MLVPAVRLERAVEQLPARLALSVLVAVHPAANVVVGGMSVRVAVPAGQWTAERASWLGRAPSQQLGVLVAVLVGSSGAVLLL